MARGAALGAAVTPCSRTAAQQPSLWRPPARRRWVCVASASATGGAASSNQAGGSGGSGDDSSSSSSGECSPSGASTTTSGASPNASAGTGAAARPAAPWALAAYYTKKLERRADALGNLARDPDLIAEPASWTPEAQLALAIKVVAQGAGADEAAVRERVELLKGVLPGGALGGPYAKPADLVRLAMRVDGVVASLLALRGAFPSADVSAMVRKHPYLLSLPSADLAASAEEFRRLLLEAGGTDPDGLVQEAPLLLEPGVLAGVLSELERLFGSRTPPGRLLQNAPHLALSCQSLQCQSRGDRDLEYLKDIFEGGGNTGLVSGAGMGGSTWIGP